MKFAKILMMSAAFAAVFAKKCIPSNKPCFVGGCSGQVCSDKEGIITTCIWEPSFACYQDATCERQANGKCGWTQTDALEECLDNAGNQDGPCYIGGCSNEVCSDQKDVASVCIWSPVLACYQDATCERQANGQCGWTQTEELQECVENANNEEIPAVEPCFVGGCSGEVCSEEEGVNSICLWTPELACYKDATCERQADGKCGWTQTEELQECIDGAAQEEVVPPVEEPCFIGGCSSEICSDEEGVNSVCIWSPVFECYKDATCERQADGKCGWTETKALKKCIKNAGNEEDIPIA